MNTTSLMFIQSIKLRLNGEIVFQKEPCDAYVHEHRIYDLACQVLAENTNGKWSCLDCNPRPMFARGKIKTYPFRNAQGQQAIVEVKYIPTNR